MRKLTGLCASEGIAAGIIACVPEKAMHSISTRSITLEELAGEKKRLKTALTQARMQLESILAQHKKDGLETAPEWDILQTHLYMLADTVFIQDVFSSLERSLKNAEAVLQEAIEKTAALLTSSGNDYLCERAVDIRDAFIPVFDLLCADRNMLESRFARLPQHALLAARMITPSEVLAVKALHPCGIVTEEGGVNSHIAIIARAWNIPLLVGVPLLMQTLLSGMPAVLDCRRQELILHPDTAFFDHVQSQKKAHDEIIVAEDVGCVYTKDGTPIHLAVNIVFAEESTHAAVQHSAGIGLYRSEFLFLGKESIPDEEHQYTVYRQMLQAMGTKQVIIRTFDAGADKMLKEQQRQSEKNALLGWRGVRYCLDREALFSAQLRAVIRAACYGNAAILIPMVSCIEEIEAVKTLLVRAEDDCRCKGIPYKEGVPFGIMVEVPSVAIAAELYAPYVDFFSIGTNDLIQYTMAADRENTSVAHLADCFQPAVLRLIQHTIQAAPFLGCKDGFVSMCGEMAAMEKAVPLLLGMGLRHFSMNMQQLSVIKKRIETIMLADAKKLCEAVTKCSSAVEIKKILEDYFPYDNT